MRSDRGPAPAAPRLARDTAGLPTFPAGARLPGLALHALYGTGPVCMLVVIMGVAGSGKTTVGELLARSLGWTFFEGDSFHPASNIEKMSHGSPLTDADRWPWLERIREEMRRCAGRGTNAVVACSALRESYRAYLAADLPDVRFVYLRGDPSTILERLGSRERHYMGPEMLASQLASLEEPTDALCIDIDHPPHEIVALIRRAVDPASKQNRGADLREGE